MVEAHQKKKRKAAENFQTAIKSPKFSNGKDVSTFFRSSGTEVPLEILRSLRNQISLHFPAEAVSILDARLLLVVEWLEDSAGARDIFGILENNFQPAVVGCILSFLSNVLSIISPHAVHHSLVQPIFKRLFSPQWMRKMHSALSNAGVNTEGAIAVLKLLNAMSEFAHGKEQKLLLEGFIWDVKVFRNLLYMRRKGKESHNSQDAISKPDIRTLCLQFILSFVRFASSIKTIFLEQHRDIILSIFKGLSADPVAVLRDCLENLWVNVWQDAKVKRTLKVNVFGEATINSLLKVYGRSTQEGPDPESVPADVVHHFLLAICAHRGIGICFADNGWYPRTPTNSDMMTKSEEDKSDGGKVFNKILANVLKQLRVNDDARQQELALKVLHACPELVSTYLPSSGLTMEPRLSSKWIANTAFLGSVIACPVPKDCFYLPSGLASSSAASQYRPNPPALQTILENVLPTIAAKVHLSKALQHPSMLVRHTAGLTLAKCLMKCEQVYEVFKSIERSLEEELEGQWARRRIDVEREMRRRVPEFQVVLALSTAASAVEDMSIKEAMLSEVSQRLISLYHRVVPSMVTEARYDVGKSLLRLMDLEGDTNGDVSLEMMGLQKLQQFHILRMLSDNTQFSWTAKPASSSPSNIYLLLHRYLSALQSQEASKSLASRLSDLLTSTLGATLLFSHDPSELQLWLSALPVGVRGSNSFAPDDSPLTDEQEPVLSFLENCLQRCAKTPHRYIEDLDNLISASLMMDSAASRARAYSMSPLVAVCLEQLSARIKATLLTPSDLLATVTFLRKVIVNLLGKQSSPIPCRTLANRLTEVVRESQLPNFPAIEGALKTEHAILDSSISMCTNDRPIVNEEGVCDYTQDHLIDDFLSAVEATVGGEKSLLQAYELVDWLRLIDCPLPRSEIKRVASIIKHLHPPALRSFILHLRPGSELLWELEDETLHEWCTLDWLILHAGPQDLKARRSLSLLTTTWTRIEHAGLRALQRVIALLSFRLDVNREDCADALCLMIALLEHAVTVLTARELSILKAEVFERNAFVRTLSCALQASHNTVDELQRLVNLLLSADSSEDCLLVTPIIDHWMHQIRLGISEMNPKSMRSIWIPFFPTKVLLEIADADLKGNLHSGGLGENVFSALASRTNEDVLLWTTMNISHLLSVHASISNDALQRLISICVCSIVPLGIIILSSHEANDLQTLTSRASLQWRMRKRNSVHLDAKYMPWTGEHLSPKLLSAISAFVYRSKSSREEFQRWMISGHFENRPVHELVAVVLPFFESIVTRDLAGVRELEKFSEKLLNVLAKPASHLRTDEEDDACIQTIVTVINAFPAQKANFAKILDKKLSKTSDNARKFSVKLSRQLAQFKLKEFDAFNNATLDSALHWIVAHLSTPEDRVTLDHSFIRLVKSLLSKMGRVTPLVAEPVITVFTQNHLCDTVVIELVDSLFRSASMKPVNVNRHLQAILQSQSFPNLTLRSPNCQTREAFSLLLHTIFHTHPGNTCQISHIQPLIHLYNGSLSLSDQRILAIFRLFEAERKVSIASLLHSWPNQMTGDRNTHSALDAIAELDPSRVFRTVHCFPSQLTLQSSTYSFSDSSIYDPVFVLTLTAQVLQTTPPSSALSWVSFFRTNTVSLIFRCLSSRDSELRSLALQVLGRLYELMETADMQERSQVIYILDLLKDTIEDVDNASKNEKPIRLPSYTTLLHAHALRGIFYPSNFMYPITARFLLQRPELDIHDVPMLFGLLYSSSDDWKKERGWMIRFLADGMMSSDDWQLLKRRHTWDLLASLFQSSTDDRALRHGILEFLANVTCHSQATTSLILKSAFIPWMEMQLNVFNDDERVAWIKIVENILAVVDPLYIEQTTRGEWQLGLVRCLTRLLPRPGSGLELLHLISRCFARLTEGKVSSSPDLSEALDGALNHLRSLEKSDAFGVIRLNSNFASDNDNCVQSPLPPHRNTALHHLEPNEGRLRIMVWGETVQYLWRTIMKHGDGENGRLWDELSSRLLLWRSIAGGEVTEDGEWLRKEVITALAQEP